MLCPCNCPESPCNFPESLEWCALSWSSYILQPRHFDEVGCLKRTFCLAQGHHQENVGQPGLRLLAILVSQRIVKLNPHLPGCQIPKVSGKVPQAIRIPQPGAICARGPWQALTSHSRVDSVRRAGLVNESLLPMAI